MKNGLLIVAVLLLPLAANGAAVDVRYFDPPRPGTDFRLTDQWGVGHSLEDYRGKVVVLNFWASWCRPCVSEMPALEKAWKTLRADQVQVVGIAVNETSADIRRFLQKQSVSFPLLPDDDATVTGEWRVIGLPTTYVLNQQGEVASRFVGPYEWDSPDSLEYLRLLQHVP